MAGVRRACALGGGCAPCVRLGWWVSAARALETSEARMGVSMPSRSRKPLANAAADICTRPSSDA
eukprot:4383307-Prymnesium_polylepis.2